MPRIASMPPVKFEQVVCPFCALGCDDLTLQVARSVQVAPQICGRAAQWFDRLGARDADASCRMRGQAVDFERAVAEAAKLLKAARRPWFAGMKVDISGARAVMDLAQRTQGALSIADGAVPEINMETMAQSGWITATLTEVKNRADTVVLFGTHAELMPRFGERILSPVAALGPRAEGQRAVHLISPTPWAQAPSAVPITHWPCAREDYLSFLLALQALALGHKVDKVDHPQAMALMQQLQASHYGAIVWSANELPPAEAPLLVWGLTRWIASLNKTGRWAGVPLAGPGGGLSVQAVHLWRSGRKLPPPPRDADLLVWVSALEDTPPPADLLHGQPVIVLAPPSTALSLAPEAPQVFIPVATPGVHHAGHLVRSDQVVMVPLRKVQESSLPSVMEVAQRLQAALP